MHNLTFTVANMDEAVGTLEKEGATVLLKFPLDWSRLAELLPEGVSMKSDPAPVHMIDAAEKVGFRLELAESPGGADPSLLDIKDIR